MTYMAFVPICPVLSSPWAYRQSLYRMQFAKFPPSPLETEVPEELTKPDEFVCFRLKTQIWKSNWLLAIDGSDGFHAITLHTISQSAADIDRHRGQRTIVGECERPARLQGIAIGDRPKALLNAMAEDLLHRFEAAPLLDAYDVYQHLQDYWYASLQDDVYQLVIDGWQPLIASGPAKGEPNTDLLPPELIVRRYYAAEAAAIADLEAKREAIALALRQQSEARKHGGATYADVDGPAAIATLAEQHANVLVHGHTHRPADHQLAPGLTRHVLSDWDVLASPPRAEVLRLHDDGRVERLSLLQ